MARVPAGSDPHPLLRELGERVRARRLELDMSQETFAELAGLHRTYVPGIEKGTRNVTVVVLLGIAAALEVSVEELIADLNVHPRRATRSRRKR